MQEIKQVVIKEEVCNFEVEDEEGGAIIIVTKLDVKFVKSMDVVQTSATSDLMQVIYHHNKRIIIQEIPLQMLMWSTHNKRGKCHSDTLNAESAKMEDIQDENWYPDTGETNDVTNNLSNLNLGNKECKSLHSLHMGNSKPVTITHTRSACIKGKRQFYPNNLLRVPLIRKNLISVSQFAKDKNVYFEFYPRYCLVKYILTREIFL